MESDDFKRVQFTWGVVMLRTKRFQRVLDRLGAYRISRPLGWVFLYLLPICAFFAFYLFFTEAWVLLSPRGAEISAYVRTIGPLANLALPGINPYLPVVDGWLALVIAVVIHEGAHGVVARSLGLPVKSSGALFLLFVPIGAFVEVDETAIKQAKASYSGRVLAAGTGINLVAGLACLALLLLLVGSMAPAAAGVGVVTVAPGGPAANGGLQRWDIITQINGMNITDLSTVLHPNTTLKAGETVNLTVYRDGDILHLPVTLGCCNVVQNATTGQNISSYPYIGVVPATGGSLASAVSAYSSPLSNLWQYVCIPTLPACQSRVPFSDTLSGFYASPLGGETAPLANFLYWMFFLNFNLAIFNALPIYPFDGGQAFGVGVKALGKGKMSEETLGRITSSTTVLVAALILGVVLAPWLYGLL